MTATVTRTDRPGYRLYRADVASVTRLSPHFVRVRFTGDDLQHFGTGRRDQRIKVIFPRQDGIIPDLGPLDPLDGEALSWYQIWRQMSDVERPPFRTYTVREVDPTEHWLDIDFVDHGGTGVAGHWLSNAQRGDNVLVAGPDGRSIHSDGGIDFHPGGASRLLLVGDETAVPAIAAICERLSPELTAHVFCEVPDAADVLNLASPAELHISWLSRGSAGFGDVLVDALGAFAAENPDYLSSTDIHQELVDEPDDLVWDTAEAISDGFYAWLAGEAGTVKRLRRLLVRDHHVDRKHVAFMGYWRLGRSET